MDDETIEQKIESDKVLEGLLKDITFGNDLISGALSDINDMQKSKYTFQERDIMDEHGSGIADLPGENVEAQKDIVEKSAENSLAIITDLLQSDSKELVNIAQAVHTIEGALQGMMSQMKAMNARQQNIAARIDYLASREAAIPAEGVTIGTGKAVKLPHEYEQEQNEQNEQGDTADQQKT